MEKEVVISREDYDNFVKICILYEAMLNAGVRNWVNFNEAKKSAERNYQAYLNSKESK